MTNADIQCVSKTSQLHSIWWKENKDQDSPQTGPVFWFYIALRSFTSICTGCYSIQRNNLDVPHGGLSIKELQPCSFMTQFALDVRTNVHGVYHFTFMWKMINSDQRCLLPAFPSWFTDSNFALFINRTHEWILLLWLHKQQPASRYQPSSSFSRVAYYLE